MKRSRRKGKETEGERAIDTLQGVTSDVKWLSNDCKTLFKDLCLEMCCLM